MPRSTRDSEEEVDSKLGRKTRLTDVVSVDSPLRRSSRIKTVKQNESSPESLSSSTSNVSNTQTRVTRKRTGTMDNNTTTETQRSLRSRMNSVSSDVNEDIKNDPNTMTPTKRNKNSIVGDAINKTNNRRSTRFTRAGSESKTSPVIVTRNTRATSMEPEGNAENKRMDKNESESMHTSSRTRRRTSVVPSEATVVEEKEETMKILRVALDRALPNVNEVKEMGSNNSLKSAQKHKSTSNAEDNFDSSYIVNEKSIKDINEMPTELDEEAPRKEESVNDSSTLKNKSTENSGSDEQKSESIQETCNKNQGSEAVEETPTELDKKVPKKEEEAAHDSSTLKDKSIEKSGTDEQKSESIQVTCNKNQGNEAVEANDSDITATNVFQDIPAAEWKEKDSAKSTNADQDSITDVVKSSPSFIVTETPTELNEDELKEEESANDSLTLKNESTEKSGSFEQKSESIQETGNKSQESEAVEDNDSDTTAGNLFQDIPAAEWKEKNDETDKNSIHSMSTERLETEMETECDLVLIDKEAWLAAENMKAAKENEAFDYDSDDTVLLKMQRDSVNAQKNEKLKMNKSVDKINDSKDTGINENDINMKDFKDETENENQDRNEHSTSKHNVSSRKSLGRKSLNESRKTTEAEENLSESITKKRKSLNKSTSKVDVSRKSLNKSIQKEMESESIISTPARKGKEKRSLNISSKKQRNCIEESENESKDSSISGKKSNAEKKFSRKRSAIRTIESDSGDGKSESGDSENKTIELPNFMLEEASNTDSNESDKSMDSDIEREYNLAGKEISKFSDDDVRGDECRASETESSDPEDNGSDLEGFIVDDVEEDEESEGEGEKINEESEEEEEKANEEIKIGELRTDKDTEDFIVEEVEGSEEEEEEKANEEIEIGELRTDKDTEDFIVEEVEESEGEGAKVNEESEEEGEKANEEIEIEGEGEKVSEESEEEEEEANEDIEIEELHTDEDTEENQEKEIKEQEEAMQVQEPDAIGEKIVEGMTEEESQDKNEQENIEEDVDKLINTSSKQKSKLETSDRLSTSQTSKKKKLKKVDRSHNENSEKENNLSDLSLSNSLKIKATKQKKCASGDFILDDIELSLNDSQPILNKRNKKLSKSVMKCSTPKSHNLPKSDEFDDDIKTSLDVDKIEDTSLKTKDTSKKLGKTKSKENLVDKRFSYGLEELVEKTKFSKPLSPKVANLNKSNLVPDSDTPTTKYLKKDKLNESAPVLKLDTVHKKLVYASGNDEQNNALNQIGEENENVNTPNSEIVPELDASLKQKVLSVAENILKADRRKKNKKRKQTTEKINTTILIEDSFLEDIESQIVNKDENVVSTTDNDQNKTVEEVSLNEEKKKEKKKKKKKQKMTHVDINKNVEEEELHEEIIDMETEISKKPKKVKKKQEKEIIEDLPDICSGNQVSEKKKKKKKKIPEALSNEEITTTRISKKKEKSSKDIAVQDDETAVEKLPKKKKKLVSEDASSQEIIPTNKLPKKKQNLSSNDTTQDNNISAEKLSKKQHKLLGKDTKSEVKPVKKSNKSQKSTDIVPNSDEGQTVVRFSEPLEEALKVDKEKKKTKQKKRMQETELENEKPKSKKQKIKDNKAESTRGIKRLSDELLENLSDVPSKPPKKRKLLKIKDQLLPSRSMFDSKAKEVEDVYVEEDFESLSSCGSTTQFAVVSMQKMKKKKKIPGVFPFKRKMIHKDSRQPGSAYLMYLEKH